MKVGGEEKNLQTQTSFSQNKFSHYLHNWHECQVTHHHGSHIETILLCASFGRVNPLSNMPDITMREAVEYLSREEGNYQLWGASFIQHSTFKEDKSKQEVWLDRCLMLWCKNGCICLLSFVCLCHIMCVSDSRVLYSLCSMNLCVCLLAQVKKD